MSKDPLQITTKENMTSCGHQLITIDATTVNRREMVLQSPGYPKGYEHQLNCAWSLLPSNKAEHVKNYLSW